MAKKILLISVAAIILCIAALTLFIKIYITPEKVKAYLIPAAEKAFNRKVDLGEIDISLFKGIQVTDFSIKESDEKTDFIACKDFVLKYRFLPLLSRRVVIEELRMDSPRVRIERNHEGTFNFEDMGDREARDEEKVKEPDAGPQELPVTLLVDSIRVKNAEFSFLDRKEELPDIKGNLDIDMGIQSLTESEIFTQGTIAVQFDEITVRKPQERQIKDLAAGLTYNVSIAMKSKDINIDTLDVRIQEIPLSISGTVINLQTSPEIDLSLSLPGANVEDIVEIIQPFFEKNGLNLSGTVKTELNVTGIPKKPETLRTSANVTMDKIGATYNNIPVSLNGTVQSDIWTNSIVIKSADFTLQGVQAIVKGTITNLKTSPEMDLTVSIPSVKTAELEKSMKHLIGTKGGPLSGNLTADFHLKGMPKNLDSLKTDGKVTLQKFGLTYNDVPVILDGDFFLKGQSVDINTNIILGKNTASLKGSVNNYLKKPDIKLNLHAEELALDQLIPAGAGKGTTSQEEELQPDKTPGEAQPLALKLSAEGEIKIDKAQYKNMSMSDFYTNYRFKNNTFEISKIIHSKS
jgi:AsmA protein